MSGGSHNYLCHKEAQDLLEYRGDLDHMVESLRGYKTPRSINAAAFTETIKWRIDELIGDLNELDERIAKVNEIWRAVEWHHSGDSGEDRVHSKLEAADL